MARGEAVRLRVALEKARTRWRSAGPKRWRCDPHARWSCVVWYDAMFECWDWDASRSGKAPLRVSGVASSRRIAQIVAIAAADAIVRS